MRDNDLIKLVVLILTFVLPSIFKAMEAAKKRNAERGARPQPFEPPPEREEPPIQRAPQPVSRRAYADPPPAPRPKTRPPVSSQSDLARLRSRIPAIRTESEAPVRNLTRGDPRPALPQSTKLVRDNLRGRENLRRAVLLSEILAPPVSERRA